MMKIIIILLILKSSRQSKIDPVILLPNDDVIVSYNYTAYNTNINKLQITDLGKIRMTGGKVRMNVTGDPCFNDTASVECRNSNFMVCSQINNNRTLLYQTRATTGLRARLDLILLINSLNPSQPIGDLGEISYFGNINDLTISIIGTGSYRLRFCEDYTACGPYYTELFSTDDASIKIRACTDLSNIYFSNVTCAFKIADIEILSSNNLLVWKDDTFSPFAKYMFTMMISTVSLAYRMCPTEASGYIEMTWLGFQNYLSLMKQRGAVRSKRAISSLTGDIVCPFVGGGGGLGFVVVSGTAFCSVQDIVDISLLSTAGLFSNIHQSIDLINNVLSNHDMQLNILNSDVNQLNQVLQSTITLLLRTVTDLKNTNNNVFTVNGFMDILASNIVEISLFDIVASSEINEIENILIKDQIDRVFGTIMDHKTTLKRVQGIIPTAVDWISVNDVIIALNSTGNGIGVDFGIYNQIGNGPIPFSSMNGINKFEGVLYLFCKNQERMIVLNPEITFSSPCYLKSVDNPSMNDVTIFPGYFESSLNLSFSVISNSNYTKNNLNSIVDLASAVTSSVVICDKDGLGFCINSTEDNLLTSSISLNASIAMRNVIFNNISEQNRLLESNITENNKKLNEMINFLGNPFDTSNSAGIYNLLSLILSIIGILFSIASLVVNILLCFCNNPNAANGDSIKKYKSEDYRGSELL